MNEQTTNDKYLLEELPQKWGWLLALGLLMVVGGSIGLYRVITMTIVTVLFFGFLLLFGGISQLVHAILTKENRWQGKFQHVLMALLYIVAGGLMVYNPIAGSAGLTLGMGALFFAFGLTKIRYGLQKRKNGWKWLFPVIAGIIDIIFALIIAIKWPLSGLWVIGIFVSIEMLLNGWFLIITALAVKKLNSTKEN